MTAMQPADLIALAKQIATEAHAGVINEKNGEDYIHHPRRVAAYAAKRAADLDPTRRAYAIAAAWLHDVIEDTEHTRADLSARGIPDEVLDIVELLTYKKGEPRAAYYARIKTHPIAVLDKLSDLDDNTNPERMAVLAPADKARLSHKYVDAYRALGEEVPAHLLEVA